MNIKYIKNHKVINFILIILFGFLFSNSMALISAGGADGEGEFDYYINYIVLFSFIFFVFIEIYFKSGKFNIGFVKNFYFYYLLFFLFLTFIQLLVGVDFRSVMFTDLFLIFMMYVILWKSFSVYGLNFIFKSINIFYFLMFFLSLFLIFFVPSWGLSRGDIIWQGMFNQKNVLGSFCVSFFLFLMLFVECKKNFITYINILLALILCLGSESYTGFFCCVLSVLIILFGKNVKLILNKLSGIILIFSLIFPFLIVTLSVGKYQFSILDKDFSFTDRDKIWLYAINNILKKPLLGDGYLGVAYQNSVNDINFRSEVGFLVNSCHNGFLGIIYNYGVIGFIAFLLVVYLYFFKARKIAYHGFYAYFILIFAIVNTFEDRIFGVNILFFVFSIMACFIEYKSKKMKIGIECSDVEKR